ncbi:unnamed protein product [Allacma fusca]|uniref:Gamma-glutamylcyclotransferase family protein n=1 Tax=Allacma fusca TaxID=39272 RepID=A0A8J2PD55_9HEXA|nr:unnamed protein product [Allacma fusca]
MYVFVYGTLKHDEPNHHWLTNEENGKATFVTKGKTQTPYPLIIASRYNIPFLLDKPGTGKNIEGEVYEIDEKMLSKLDILEEYPKLYVRREEVILVPPEVKSEGVLNATIYFLPSFQPDLLTKPFLESYSSNGPHNLRYVASEDDLSDAKDI